MMISKLSLATVLPIVGFLLSLILFFTFFFDILLPFLIGMVFAYLFDPLVSILEQKLKIPRAISSSALVLGLFAVLVVFCIILIPYIQAQLVYLVHNMPQYIKLIQDQVTKLANKFSDFFPEQDISSIKEGVSNILHGFVDWGVVFASGLLSKGLVFANILSLIIITPIVAIFFLKDWPNFVGKIENLVPRRYSETVFKIAKDMHQKLRFWVRGQALIAFILILYYSTALSIIQVGSSVFIALISGLFSFIPYFAVSFGFVASIFSGVFSNFGGAGYMAILVVFILGGLIEGAVLSPLLIGNSVGLHPLWIVFAVMAGAKIGGFMGVLIAVPVAAVLGVVIRFSIQQYLQSAYYKK